jgi:leucyl-tRNA synthetase
MEHMHSTMQAMALEDAFTEYGVLVHSDYWNGKTSEAAKTEMTAYAEKHGFGESATTYRLRDWGVSRQRFWGSPIPIVYCDTCGTVPERYENLPVELPDTAPFTGTGESPLAKVPEFYETKCPNCNEPARRETDTMDTFVDSSWYYFRYLDPNNSDMPFEPEKAAYWTPVDQYIGGDDHAVMHLIYTRFWTKVMKDLGLVNFDEPVKRLLTQGMVVGETFFDESTGKRVYYPPSNVTVERDAKGKVVAVRSKDGKELKNAIERACLDAKMGLIRKENLFFITNKSTLNLPGESLPTLREARNEAERRVILRALELSGGNRVKACEMLEMNRTSFYSRLKELGIK